MVNFFSYVVLFFVFFSTPIFSQNVYFGIPNSETEFYESDIIILNEIHWQNGFLQFSKIGINQIAELDSLLNNIKIERNKLGCQVRIFQGAGGCSFDTRPDSGRQRNASIDIG